MLYLVPTPIGNLGDISARALTCLSEVDFIAAEDTRVTVKLLNHFAIKKPMMPYYRHNQETGGAAILSRILSGQSCALVSDAGTPAISDPGEELVKLCVEAGVTVTALPGACAMTTALSVSGLPTGRFTFEGFLAMNKKNRRQHLADLAREERTMIFYEAPHKLLDTLADFETTFGGERPLVLCRELSKLHEEIIRGTVASALAFYENKAPRGEYVLILGGGEREEEVLPTLEDGLAVVSQQMAEGVSMKDAVKAVAAELKLSKNQLYQRAKNL